MFKPHIDYRSSRWPPSKGVVDEINRFQRKLVAVALREPRQYDDTAETYRQRRGRNAALAIGGQGHTWGNLHCERVLKWMVHLRRPRNVDCLAVQVSEVVPPEKLTQRRNERQGNRTGTRAVSGIVQMRWPDGVSFAKSYTGTDEATFRDMCRKASHVDDASVPEADNVPSGS